MGRYLNSQTRHDVVLIAGTIEQLDDICWRWNINMKNPPKKALDYIKAGVRFISRGMREIDKELDNDEVARIYKMAESTKFQMVYDQYDLTSKAPGVITYDITEDERDNIVEALAEVRCSTCDGCVENCKVREQFFKWDIKPIYEYTDETYPCQYMPPDEMLTKPRKIIKAKAKITSSHRADGRLYDDETM